MATRKKPAARPISSFDDLDAAGIGAGWQPMVQEQEVAPPAPEQDGPMARGVKQVSASVGLAGRLAARDFDGAAQNISDQAAYRAANPGSEEAQGLMRAWQQGDGIWGGIKGVAGEIADDYRRADGVGAGVMSVGRNLQAMGSGLLVQVPNMALPMVGMIGGGAAGSAAGPVGTVAGGWAGASAGNALVGTSEAAFRQLEKAGVNPSDAAAVREYLANNGDAILGETAIKGGVIGAVDVATAGLAHWLLSGPGKMATTKALTEMGVDMADKAAVKAATKTPAFKNLIANDATYQATQVGAQKLLRNTGAAATEPVGEFVGEYGGSLAATGEADAKDAFLEAASSLGQSGIMFAGQKAIQAIKSPAQAAADQIRTTEKLPESGPMTRASNAATEAKAQAIEAGAPLLDEQAAAEPVPEPVDDPVRDQIIALPDGARQDALRAYAVLNRPDVAKGVQQYNRKLLDRLLAENAPQKVEFSGSTSPTLDEGVLQANGVYPPAVIDDAVIASKLLGPEDIPQRNMEVARANIQRAAERRPPMLAGDADRILGEEQSRGLDFTVAQHPDGGFVVLPRSWVTPDIAAQGERELNETITRMQQADAAPVERAPRTRAAPVELSLPTDPVQNFIGTLRTVNTPAARAYVQDFDAGRITPADVQQRMVAEQGVTPDQRLERAAAEAPAPTDPVAERLRSAAAQAATVAPTDILNPQGLPFKTKMAADLAAKKSPGAAVLPVVDGGFVVRPKESVNVQDVPQAPEVPQAAPVVSPPSQAPQAVGTQPASPAAGVPTEGVGAVEAAGVEGSPPAAPTIVEVQDNYGRTHRVRQSDLYSNADRIPTVRKNGEVVAGEEIPRSIVKDAPSVAEQPPIDPLGWNAKKLASTYDMAQMQDLYQYVLRNYSNPVVGGGPVENGKATTERFNAEGREIHKALQQAQTAIYERSKAQRAQDGQTAAPIGKASEAAKSVAQAGDADAIAALIQQSIAENRIKANEKIAREQVAKGYLTQEQADADLQRIREGFANTKPNQWAQSLAKAIAEKDPRPLVGAWAKEGQGTYGVEGSMAGFEKATGVKLRRLNSADRAKAIFDWAGWTEDQVAADVAERRKLKAESDAAIEAKSQAEYDDRITERAAKELVLIKDTQQKLPIKEYVDGLISQGYNTILSSKRGAITKTYLANQRGDGYPLPVGVMRDYAQAAVRRAAAPNSGAQRTAAPQAEAAQPATRKTLMAIANRLGVTINTTNGGFKAGKGMVDIPPEDARVEGALSPDHVVAHELGHAAMQKRGISFQGHPIGKIKQHFIPNWDALVEASKAFRPAVWGHADARIKAHARKPNEVLADAIGSVYLGLSDVSLLEPMMQGTGTTLIDLGLADRNDMPGERPSRAEAPRQDGNDFLPEGWTKSVNGFTKRPVYRMEQGVGQPFAVVTQTEGMTYEVQIRHGDKQLTTGTQRGALSEVLADAQAELAKMTQAASVTHQDPGEKPEAATKGVVNDSIKTAAKNEDTKPSEMRKWLLAEIDKELLRAPDRADYDEAVKRVGEKDAISMYTGNGFMGKNTETGFITFDVPGDGKFKVRNSVRGLLEFRKTVMASPGFKDSGQRTKAPERNDGVQDGSGGKMAAVVNMIEEGDFEAARDYAEAVGINLEDVKVPRGDRKPQWEKYLKDGTLPPAAWMPSKEWQFQDIGASSFVPDSEKKSATLTRVADGSTYVATVKGSLDNTSAKYTVTKDGKEIGRSTTRAPFSETLRMAEYAMPEANDKPAPSKSSDTGWNMAGTGYGGKRYRGRNITMADGREVVARIYENAGRYNEVEIKVDGVRKFTVIDEYNAEEKADAFIRTLTAQEIGPFGPILTQYRGDAQGAIKALTELKDGEAVAALSHPEIGDIDLVWGKEGTRESNGFGLSKLVKWHPEVLDDLQGVVSSLTVVERTENRIQLESDKHKAAVRLEWDKQAKHWLLTAFEKKEAGGGTRTDTAANDAEGDTARLDAGKVSVPEPTKEAQADTPKLTAEQRKVLDDSLLAGAMSVEDYMKATGLTDEDVGTFQPDGLRAQAEQKARAANPYYQLTNKIQDALSDQMKSAMDAASSTPQQRKSKEERIARITRDRSTLDMLTRKFEHPFNNNYVSKLSPILKSRFNKQFEGVKTGEFAKAEFNNASYQAWAELLIEAAGKKAVADGFVEPAAAKSAPTAKPAAAPQPAAPTATGVVENFGEKLPPARRSMAAKLSEDLTDDKIATLPLSQIWPAAENDAIEDIPTAAVAHVLREAIPAKPRVAYKVKSWVSKVKVLRDFAASVMRGDIGKDKLLEEMQKVYALRDLAAKIKLLEQIDRSQWKRIGDVSEAPNAFRYEEGKQVPTPSSSVNIDGKNHWFNGSGNVLDHIEGINAILGKDAPESKMQFEIRQEMRGERKVFINKKGDKEQRRLMEFATVEEARKAINEQYADLVAAWEGVKGRDNITERDLRSDTNRDRTGKDHRQGRDVTAEEFEKQFGFRGGEFGKWVGQGKAAQERQFMLNSAYDALMDLSDLLGIPPKAISLEGSLGIAFGSRGSGWASAHFEPSNLVINLTKTRGAGALAHEWFHALDNYFARKRGGEVLFAGDQAAYRRDNFITHKTKPMMVRKDGRGSPLTKERLAEWRKSIPNSGYLAEDQWVEDPSHKQGVRVEVEQAFDDLVKTLNDSPMLKRARRLDGVKDAEGYWSRVLEMAARSFENYIQTRMMEQGYHNDFLANVKAAPEVGKNVDRYPYLLPSEIAPVADAFKVLFDTIQTKETEGGNVAMFSRSPSTKSAYEARIDALFAGEKAAGPNQGARVLDRSDVLGLLGFGDGPVNLAEGKVIKGQENHPRMTADIWKKVPQWLENPAAVFDSDTVAGRLVFVAPELVNGASVRLIVEPNVKHGRNEVAVHLLQNAYDAPGKTPFGRWVNDNKLRYIDKKVFPAIVAELGLQLPNAALSNKPGTAKILTEKNLAGYRRSSETGFSRGAGKGMPVSTAQQIVTAIRSKWANAPDVVVVASMQDPLVPEAARAEDARQKSQGATGEPRGFIYKGKVYLLSDQLKGPEQIAEVLFHEVLGHYGLRGAFGDSINSILQQMGTMRRKDVVAKAREYGLFNKDALGGLDKAAASDSQIWAAMSNKQRLDAAEEVLAEMAQTQPTIGFVKRAIAAIRNWLREHVPGFDRLKLTDNDIIQGYILPARAYVEHGANERSGKAAGMIPAFMRNNEPMPENQAPGPQGDAQQGANKGNAVANKNAPTSGTSDAFAGHPNNGMQERAVRAVAGSPELAQFAEAGSEAHLSTLRAVDVFGNGNRVEYYDDAKGLMYSMQKYPRGERWTAWDVLPTEEGGNQVIGEFDHHKSFADAVQSIRGARISASARARIAKYSAIPNTWDGDAKKLAKALIDAGVPIDRFSTSTQSRSKYIYLDDGRKIRLADHDLPGTYDAPDYDFRYGGDIKRLVEQIKSDPSTPVSDGVSFSRTKDQTQTPEFRRWFGESKVVDADGKPMVMYHGTQTDFNEFRPSRRAGGLTFVTADPKIADGYAVEGGGYTTVGNAEDRVLVEQFLREVPNPTPDDFKYYDLPADVNSVESLYAWIDAQGEGANVMPLYVKAESIFGSREAPIPWRDAEKMGAAGLKVAGYDAVWVTEQGGVALAVVDPKQLKSATGNNGNFDPANPDIRFSRTTEAAKAVGDAIKSVTVTNIKQRAGFKLTDYLGIGLQALGRRQIVDIYGDLLPLAEYNRLVTQMEADKNDGGAEADRLVTRWAKLADEAKLADLMHDATLAQIDPEKPYVDGDDKGKFLILERKFKLLSDDAKAVYRETRDAYKAHHAKVRSAIKERIERSELKGARKAELLQQMDSEFFAAVKGVYFPLARFGQYVVTVKGPDGKVESVSRAEAMAEADALRTNLLSAFPREKGFTVGRVMLSKEFVASRDAVGRGFMTELYQVLDKQDMDAAQRAELEDTLGQLYLSSLPDLSWAKHGIHRKGTPGFSQDARRAYAQNMFHGARYLAKLRYSDLMQDELTAMQKHVDDWREVEDFDQTSAQRVVDEMNKRHESLMNPKSNKLSTWATSLGFVFHLGLSPASAMVNLSQTALVAYPIMGAKWGFGKASAALLKASAEAAKGKNDITASLNADELAAYNEAVRAGTIDVTMAHDLAGIAQGEDAGVMWKIRPVMRYASFLFHHAERFNRQVTFVAAYRLAREAGADHKTAFEQATKATYDGHFDYSSSNRPRIMQGNVAKVLLLFKQYGQNMVYTLSRNAYQSIKGTATEKAEARKALGGLLAMHAAAAGVLGLPMVTTLLAAASMIGGDDDEPWDAKVALQNMLADALGQKPAEVLAHGLSRLTPWDISGRVGLDKLIFPDVQEGLEGQRLWESAATQALGPVGGIFGGVLKGLDLMSDGHYKLGLEAMLPAALRQAVKSVRYGMDGAQDKSGVSIKDEVSTPAVVGQFLGFSPSEVRNAQEGKSAVYQQDRALGERRQELLTKAARATMAKDAEARAEAMKEIERFNQKNPTRRITPLNVLQSVRNRNKRIDQAEGGIYLPKSRRDAMQAGRFAVEE